LHTLGTPAPLRLGLGYCKEEHRRRLVEGTPNIKSAGTRYARRASKTQAAEKSPQERKRLSALQGFSASNGGGKDPFCGPFPGRVA
jgi:hypothetical protein